MICDRYTQTFNNLLRDQSTQSAPPPRASFSANASPWAIYDLYQEDLAQPALKEKSRTSMKTTQAAGDELQKIGRAVKILERMVNQNTFDDVAQDYKYYEDPSDEFRAGEGSLLPLWTFSHSSAHTLSVTSLRWSPKYTDLFVVAHGSYEFINEKPGLICFYSLKNPCYPELTIPTESGVLCLDVHPEIVHFLCAGLYNGAVCVFDVRQQRRTPVFCCTADSGKHTGPVWSVHWERTDPGSRNLKLWSVSADGRVSLWTLVKEGVGAYHDSPTDLIHEDVLRLQTKEDNTSLEDGGFELDGSGTTFDFHPSMTDIFLVGTEDGLVHKCSKSYSSQFVQTYNAHQMAVYKVEWNPFHSDVFLTCSADWQVKIWTHHLTDPVFIFDLNSSVGDVAWAPYSSTVFAAATADGRVYVYDLSVSKLAPVCVQVVVQKRRTMLTQLAFNPRFPILIVGDNKGSTTSLKLSPNLRRGAREMKGYDGKKTTENEKSKLDLILRMAG